MAKIAKIQDGYVVIVNEFGGMIGSRQRPNDGGDAVFVDLNQSNGKIAVTSSKGRVWIYNEYFGNLCNFSGNGTPIRAQWVGNDLAVHYSNGKCESYSDCGGYKHPL